MKISTLLVQHMDVFSKDAKQRIANGQIEINGEKVKDIDISIKLNEFEKPIIHIAGTFLCTSILDNPVWRSRMQIFGVESLWDFDNDLSKFFSDFLFIKISKKDIFILEKLNG